MRKILIVVSTIAAALLSSTSPVSAAYPVDAPTISVSVGVVITGDPFTITAGSFCPGTTITFTVAGSIVGTASAAADGTASIGATAPLVPGIYTVAGSANCSDSGAPAEPGDVLLNASTSINVVEAVGAGGPVDRGDPTPGNPTPGDPDGGIGGPGGEDLPVSGSNSLSLIQAAIVIVLAGASAFGVSRYRRRSRVSTATT